MVSGVVEFELRVGLGSKRANQELSGLDDRSTKSSYYELMLCMMIITYTA